MKIDGRAMYLATLSFDSNVRAVPRYGGRSSFPRPIGSPVVKFPASYYKFANKASLEEVDKFWDYMMRKDYDAASRISGMKWKDLVAIISAINAGYTRTAGSPQAIEYYFGDIPLERWKAIVFQLPTWVSKYWRHYANRGHGPPWEALPKRALEAFDMLAEAYNDALE